MFRRATAALIALLLLGSVLLCTMAAAVDTERPDTSGYDLDLDGYVSRLLDDPLGAMVMGAPRYRWDPERYMEEGDRCAERYRTYQERFMDHAYVIYQRQSAGQGNPVMDKDTFSRGLFGDADSAVLGPILQANDPDVTENFHKMEAYGSCIRKNYNAAIGMLKDDDYPGKAAAWDRAAQMYRTLGDDDGAAQSSRKAEEYRKTAETRSLLDALFQPVPAWPVAAGVAGGLLLFRRKRA